MDEAEQKRRALELMLEAWDKALSEGVEAEIAASVAIFAALADMVDRHGADAVAEFCATLPGKARAGEFTLRAD
jgi:N-methylhydantoinase B/oxoprolinase/acetone carboxylase alpha subunit